MPKLKSRLTILLLTALGALLMAPATGQAATDFGSRLNHEPANSGECEMLGSCTIVSFIHPSEPNGDPYSGGAPVSGVITKFRIRAYVPTASQVTFRLADINRPDPNDANSALATAAGTGPTVTLQPNPENESPILEFPGRLPVKKGQHLALDGTNVQATYNNSGDKFSYVFQPPLVDGTGARGSLEATGELLVAATIEPDADGDGFGDETQDKCPTQAATQGTCVPPDVTKPDVSGFSVANGQISYSLSEAATVNFQLAKKLSGRKVGTKCVKKTTANQAKKKCPLFKNVGAIFNGTGQQGKNTVTLPNGKKLKSGSYRLTMTATDGAGNVTTVSANFKVAKKKKK